jgi:hypothetical protein
MNTDRNKLYLFIACSCLAGYAWLAYNLYQTGHSNLFTVCFIKNLTGIPCPSCGSTRSVIEIFQGNILHALQLNPIGFIISFAMICAPIWLILDLVLQKNTLFNFYKKFELTLKKRVVALPLILLFLINWIWNIYKDL